jgi:hypothetical protein
MVIVFLDKNYLNSGYNYENAEQLIPELPAAKKQKMLFLFFSQHNNLQLLCWRYILVPQEILSKSAFPYLTI